MPPLSFIAFMHLVPSSSGAGAGFNWTLFPLDGGGEAAGTTEATSGVGTPLLSVDVDGAGEEAGTSEMCGGTPLLNDDGVATGEDDGTSEMEGGTPLQIGRASCRERV